jgi:hypothetical protein
MFLPGIGPAGSGATASGTAPSLHSTIRLPKIAAGQALDETIMLPISLRINDATTVLPAVSGAPGPDDTVVMKAPHARRPPPDEVLMGEVPAAEAEVADAEVGRTWLRPLLVEAGIIVAILGMWLFSVSRTSADNVGDYGLLSVMHPAYFAAVALLRGALHRGARPETLARMDSARPDRRARRDHARDGASARVYEPEYAWTYKHVGVVEHFRAYGVVTNALDIYQRWPTLFAVVAHLVDSSGVSALRVAAWAPVFFDLAFCVPLFAIARTFTDRRVPYLTVFLFSAANWVAQDYLAPQAFTYVLGLGSLLIMLRWLRRTTGRHERTPPRIARLWAWVGSGLAEVPYTSKYASRAVVVVLYIVYAVVVASHQLSPYLIAMTACGLVALGLVRPLRIVPVLLSIAVLYLVPRYQIAAHYGLFNFDIFGHATSAGPVDGTTAGRVLSAQVVQFLSLTVWALAALGVVASWRRPGPIAAPAVLAFSPFGLLLAQSYGGEAIYRVYLFSIPWCAYLIATLLLRKRWLPRGVGVPGATIVVTATVLASMQGAHGQLLFNRFTPDEVAASTFIYTHAEPGADIVLAAGNFPTRLAANYDGFSAGPNGDHGLLPGDKELLGLALTEADLPKINSFFNKKTPSYLVFSPAMSKYLHYFGYAPDGLIERLQTTISGSPNWRICYRNQDVSIYKYFP